MTGGTGFIGSHIAQALKVKGHEVIVTGNDIENKFDGKILRPTLIGIDWKEIGRIDVLIHQAALNDVKVKDEQEMQKSNVEASKQLFIEAVNRGCHHIVYASSTAAYGNIPTPYKEDQFCEPLNAYGRSKRDLDEWAMNFAQTYKVTVVGLRYSNVYGPGESHKKHMSSMIFQFAQQILHGQPIVYGDGTQKRSYIYVKDAVTANLLAMESKESCILNCGGPEAVSSNKLIQILFRTMGMLKEIKYIENPHEQQYQPDTSLDMSKAKEKIGFIPKWNIQDGIKDYHNKTGFAELREGYTG